MKVDASSERVWRSLVFYEEIEERPPLLLRLLLPLPLGTECSKSNVGDEVKCLYAHGYLIKRLTHVDPGHHYGFEIVEQSLRIGGGLRLSGGCYTLRALASDATELAVTTRYTSPWRPAWLWRRLEAPVCHMFHRYLLSAIGRRATYACAASSEDTDAGRPRARWRAR